MVKSRTLRLAEASHLSIALENEKRRPEAAVGQPKADAVQRISEAPELVIAIGLPALITWVDWAVWL